MIVGRSSAEPLKSWFGRLARGGGGGVNHIALGTFCHAAAGLRVAGLRQWSGPFDWIFSTPAMIADCIADDFALLLDPRHLASVPAAELTHGARRQCRHPVYEARYNLPIIFNHHDPASSNADLWRLRRSVGRFRTAFGGRDPNVFYLVSERAWPDDEVSRLAEALARSPAGSRLAVVTLTAADGAHACTMEDGAGPGCRRLEVGVTIRSRSRGAAFGNAEDDQYFAEVLMRVATRLDPTINGHI
jgi:hypothetical protein